MPTAPPPMMAVEKGPKRGGPSPPFLAILCASWHSPENDGFARQKKGREGKEDARLCVIVAFCVCLIIDDDMPTTA